MYPVVSTVSAVGVQEVELHSSQSRDGYHFLPPGGVQPLGYGGGLVTGVAAAAGVVLELRRGRGGAAAATAPASGAKQS